MDRLGSNLEGDEVGAVVEPLVADCQDDEEAVTRPVGAPAQADGPAMEPLRSRDFAFSPPPSFFARSQVRIA